jgi:hypothetical protein
MSENTNVTNLPDKENVAKKPEEMLKAIKNEAKGRQAKEFQDKARAIQAKIDSANKAIKLAEKEMAHLVSEYNEGLL